MSTIPLSRAEKFLFDMVEHGDPAKFRRPGDAVVKGDGVFRGANEIDAEVLRHIILGLPLRRRIGGAAACTKTGRGILISKATIKGRLKVDSAFGPGGQALCPIEFVDCIFDGGFSGAHGHFSRLSFRRCKFEDRKLTKDDRPPLPTIDLSGAEIERTLDMQGVAPVRDCGLLWIRAAGLNLKRDLDLCGCVLRAPDPTPAAAGADNGRDEGRSTLSRSPSAGETDAAHAPVAPGDEGEDALDLSLSRIGGDLTFFDGGTVTGRFKLRSARVAGDLWLRGAHFSAPRRPHAILMQGSRIGGYVMMDASREADGKTEKRSFVCEGLLKVNSVEIGLAMHLKGTVQGGVVAHDLRVREDVILKGVVEGEIDLRDVSIGGSLSLGGLHVRIPSLLLGEAAANRDQQAAGDAEAAGDPPPPVVLDLQNGTIGRSLSLGETDASAGGPGVAQERRHFQAEGVVDLSGLTCGTLEDDLGRHWGDAHVSMNQFVYRQTEWLPHIAGKKPGHRILLDWAKATWIESRWLPRPRKAPAPQLWEPWQLRRNWIFRNMGVREGDIVDALRRGIPKERYRPQPLEQAIRVAREEGREDFATHFEVVKQRIEWRHFNERGRWWFANLAIALAALWLVLDHGPGDRYLVPAGQIAAIGVSLAATLILMLYASTICGWFRMLGARRGFSRSAMWLLFFVPALLLLIHPPWWNSPFHFLIALLIFLTVRLVGVISHGVMRFGFGYLRRPVLAIITLIGAFLVGWWGVHLANSKNMFVIAAQPSAGVAAPNPAARYPASHPEKGTPVLMGSELRTDLANVRGELSCAATFSEPLYALDVLVPIIDLGEESRCEIRRVAEPKTHAKDPDVMGWTELVREFPPVALGDHRFWWWMRALYALAGWIVVSLALLTFAQVNRTRPEPTMSG